MITTRCAVGAVPLESIRLLVPRWARGHTCRSPLGGTRAGGLLIGLEEARTGGGALTRMNERALIMPQNCFYPSLWSLLATKQDRELGLWS